MLRSSLLFAAFLIVLPPFTPIANAGDAAPPKPETAALRDTVVGEVVDIQCLLKEEASLDSAALSAKDTARSQGWNACGTEAVRRGAPVGIRQGGNVYVAVMEDRKPAGRVLAPYLGQEVAVAGLRRTGRGIRVIEIARLLRLDGLDSKGVGEPR